MGGMTRFSILLLALTAATQAPPATFEEARSVYFSGDVPRAEALYRTLAEHPATSPGDRASAIRELARIAWLVDGEDAQAVRLLTQSMPADPDPCPAALLLGRILNEGGQSNLVPARLALLKERCAAIEPGVALQLTRAQILTAAATPPNRRTAAVAAARAAWQEMPELTRSGLEAARQRLRIGLLAGDAEAALGGWRDYFWLGDAGAPQAFGDVGPQVIAAFRAGARPGARRADALALASWLVRAGFADEARQLASDHALARSRGSLAAQWRKIDRYLRMREALVAATLSHDRGYARGRRDGGDAYKSDVERIMREAVAGLGRRGAAPMNLMHELWGLYGTPVGDTGGVQSLHLGHTMIDARQEVVQGNRRGSIRFIALDNMIANAFSSWLPDGAFGNGGWATGGHTIIQVRPLYAGSVLRRLATVDEGVARTHFVERMNTLEAEDRRLIAGGRIVFLPGMDLRFVLQAVDGLAAEVRAADPDPATFAQRFRTAWSDRSTLCSITFHEGRHVLDQAQFTGAAALSGAELEYRAKLSEIALCPSPRIIMGAIHDSNLGDGSHGTANLRILTAYARWISEHRSEVAGFDPQVPDFAQLYKLTDDQLRTVAAALDREIGQ